MKNIIYVISFLVLIILGLYLTISGINSINKSLPKDYMTTNKAPLYQEQTPETDTIPNFITPESVNTGYIQNSPQSPADACRPKGSALYPIQQPYVNYGKWKGGDCCTQNCDVIRFNEPP